MGGGGWYYVPKVWTPTGGWWNNPTAWKRNTGIAGGVIFCLAAGVFRLSANLERRPIKPRFNVPSERWIKHPPGIQ
eukprot:CAMPEP_0194133232 /NCGR_PEP_ID=MMETSP0152-20130528/3489_1 /TAXON_ID=1049557 /ORGANISM="Thalassiothrix antarctica, Strain L6-D1" /LENGTH=75 /DNA_ID=CAMNT_0038828507 /DNA_START=44 /DNA_END=271 /DNA_ORIENTATION=-